MTPPSARVLVVDDEPSVTAWLAEEIKAMHPEFEVLEPNDGYSAGETVASSRPNVIILDLRMPGIDGFDVCRRIKSQEETRDISVIAMTAHPSEKARHGILEAGAVAYFTKPLDVEALLAEVESAMAG